MYIYIYIYIYKYIENNTLTIKTIKLNLQNDKFKYDSLNYLLRPASFNFTNI